MLTGYFDYNATAPLRPVAAQAMQSAMTEALGNPSSMHAGGRAARARIDEARKSVAAFAGVTPSEIVFTSGATESNNLALRGAMAADPSMQLVVSDFEHASVRETATALQRQGRRVRFVDVSDQGVPLLATVAASFAEQPTLVSTARASGETGHTLDIDALLAMLPAEHLLHVDATQALARIDDPIPERADLISFSGHKLGGPAGIGVLVVRERAKKRLDSWLSGGPQENGLRAGTENILAIIGLGATMEALREPWQRQASHLRLLRDLIQFELLARVEDLQVITPEDGLPNTLMVSIPGVPSETLVAGMDLEGFAISTGSACAAASPEPSKALQALGLEASVRDCCVRVSLGWASEEQQIPAFLDACSRVVTRARSVAAQALA